MVSGIYKITNLITGKFYVGSSQNINRRWGKHLQKLNTNTHPNIHLQRSFNVHGEYNFELSVLEYCCLDDLIPREQHYIDELKPHYNIARVAGSSVGVVRSDETKEKLRIIGTGKKQSAETIEKRASKLRGKWDVNDKRRDSYRASKIGKLNPVFTHGWDKQVEAMRKANIGCKRDKSVGEKIGKALSKPVVQLTLNGDFVAEWNSACEIERILGHANSRINKVCRGLKNLKTAYGFLWKFKSDYCLENI